MPSWAPPWRSALLAVLLSLGLATSGWTQGSAPGHRRDRLWLTLGAGLGRTGASAPAVTNSLAGGAGLTYQPGLLLFGLHTEGVWNPLRGDILGDAALLVGVGTRGAHGHLSIALGPALSGGQGHPFEASRTRFSSELSLAIHAQLLALALPSLGGGFTGFVNLNHHQSFGGVLFNLAFGQLR